MVTWNKKVPTVASDSLLLSSRYACVTDIDVTPFFVTSTLETTCLLSVTCFFLSTTGDADNVPPIPRLNIFSSDEALPPNKELRSVATLCCVGSSIELSPLRASRRKFTFCKILKAWMSKTTAHYGAVCIQSLTPKYGLPFLTPFHAKNMTTIWSSKKQNLLSLV